MGLFDRLRKPDKEEKHVDQYKYKFVDSFENKSLFNEATEYLQERKNGEAIRLFDKILETEPNNIHVLNGKGSGLMQSGRVDEAEKVFDKSLTIHDDNPMAYLNKTIIYGNKGDYDDAIRFCDKILESFPEFREVALGLKNDFIQKINKKSDTGIEQFNNEVRELINKANKLKEENGKVWKADEKYEQLQSDMPEFKRITLYDAWDLYEQAIEKDSSCERVVTEYINQLKVELMQEFLFFDISKKEDFNPKNESDRLKLNIMKHIYLDKEFTLPLAATNQILTTIDENDIDALNFKGALLFYFDEIDDSINCFEKVKENGNGIYEFFADFNKAIVLRRKTMITKDTEYMVQAMDIYDEMLKDPQCFQKVKPYQREILDKLQSFMNVPLF